MNIPGLLNSAVQYHQAGNLPEAQRLYRDILKRQPRHADALHLLGVAEHQTGQHAAALQHIEQAIAIQPDSVMYLGNLASVQTALGQPADAIETCRRGIQLDGTWIEGLHTLGSLLAEQGDYAGAAESYQRALALQPDFLEALNNLAEVRRCQGDHTQAAACFRRAVELAPDHPDLCNGLGNVLREQGDHAAAESSIRKAIAGREQFPEAWHNLGLVLQDTEKFDEAAECFRRALSLLPGHVDSACLGAECLRAGGHLAEAETMARQAVDLDARNARVRLTLGNILFDDQSLEEAAESFELALQIDSGLTTARSNLAETYRQLSRFDEAEQCCRDVLRSEPDNVAALTNLGAVLSHQGQYGEAEVVLRRANELQPGTTEILRNLAATLCGQDRFDDAAALLRDAVDAQPRNTEVRFLLADELRKQVCLEESAFHFRQMLALDPENVDALERLAAVLIDVGPIEDAIALAERAVELRPDSVITRSRLGYALLFAQKYEEAQAAFRAALEVDDSHANSWKGLGNSLRGAAEPVEAVQALDQAIKLDPENAEAYSQRIYTAQFVPDITAARLKTMYDAWDARLVQPLKVAQVDLTNDPDPDRRLRLGIASPNFRRHPAMYLTLPALEHLDHSQFGLFCYSNVVKPDETTTRMQEIADQWIDADTLSDEKLADRIRDDGIDILIVMGGHSGGNRQLVAARRAAPLQIGWTGDPSGNSEVDYLIVDPFIAPPEFDSYYMESPLRMPHDYVVFEPPDCAPPVGPLPFEANGFITFASFNQSAKYHPELLRLWADILLAVPNSRLLLVGKGMTEQSERLLSVLLETGVARDRIELRNPVPREEVLDAYNTRVDIALDPFPFSGGVTTLEAVWMGVPVITLPMENFAGRTSVSHLSNIGLTDCVVSSREEYLNKAVSLAENPTELADLRHGLRDRVQSSSLCDGPGYMRDLSSAFRNLWREWCAGVVGRRPK